MKRTKVTIFLILLFLLLSACAPQAPAIPASPAVSSTPRASASAPQTSPKEAWEVTWLRLAEDAKREGRVVVLSVPGPEARVALGKAFKQRFGIPLEFLAGRGNELAERIMSERRAGLSASDLLIGGTNTFINLLKPYGALEPLEPALLLPELTQPQEIAKTWWGGQLLWVDRDRTLLRFYCFPSASVGINTDQVKPDEIKSYRDLLHPKWKGKIVIDDPTVEGSGGKWAATVGSQIMGWDYLREFAKQEPVILRNQRLQVEWLAHGKYPISIKPHKELILEFQRAGAPVKMIEMAEGGYLTSGNGTIGLINKAPHPNATKLFINWLFTREVQTLLSQVAGYQSGREDVPVKHLDPIGVRQPGVKYIDADLEALLLKDAEYRKMAAEIFAAVLKK